MRLTTVAIALCLTGVQVHAKSIVAQCEALKGPRVDYADLTSSGKHTLTRSEDNFGPRAYVWDSKRPEVLQELKSGRAVDLQKPGQVDVTFLDVVKITTGAIVAVEVYGNGVFTHTLWPERGFFIMTRTSAQTTGAVGAVYYAKCQVTSKN